MKIDLKEAFTFVFKDERWIPKVLIAAGLAFGAAIISGIIKFTLMTTYHIDMHDSLNALKMSLPGLIITLPISILIYGYLIDLSHNLINNIEPKLPGWSDNWGKFFLNGLKGYGVSIIYGIAIGIFYAFMCIPLCFKHDPVTIAIVLILFLVSLLIFIAFTLVAFNSYAEDYSFGNALNIKRVWQIFTKSYPYLILILLAKIVVVILALAILIISCIGILLIPVAMFISSLISMNLYAQVYKGALAEINNSQIPQEQA